jgi:hypothetical protein
VLPIALLGVIVSYGVVNAHSFHSSNAFINDTIADIGFSSMSIHSNMTLDNVSGGNYTGASNAISEKPIQTLATSGSILEHCNGMLENDGSWSDTASASHNHAFGSRTGGYGTGFFSCVLSQGLLTSASTLFENLGETKSEFHSVCRNVGAGQFCP